MPTAGEILDLLSASAHRALPVSIAWHLIVTGALIALALGWRPSQRRAGQLLSLPFLSVGLVSLATGNPFNAVVFTGLSVVLGWLARRGAAEIVRLAPDPFVILGTAMLAVGWVYPHFLADRDPLIYLYAAPIGVVPCATLYLVIGFALLGPVVSRAWLIVLCTLGLIYGVTGIVLLGVALDLGLVVGAVGLALRWTTLPKSALPKPRLPRAVRS